MARGIRKSQRRNAFSRSRSREERGNKNAARSGFTLTELMVVVTMIGIMIAIIAPSFRQAIEQSRADLACANLRSVWAAERLYWLEYQTYQNIDVLQNAGILDTNFNASTAPYAYSVSIASDGSSFNAATASRMQGGSNWGSFTITSSGAVSGTVAPPGLHNAITPTSFW